MKYIIECPHCEEAGEYGQFDSYPVVDGSGYVYTCPFCRRQFDVNNVTNEVIRENS